MLNLVLFYQKNCRITWQIVLSALEIRCQVDAHDLEDARVHSSLRAVCDKHGNYSFKSDGSPPHRPHTKKNRGQN